MAIYSRLTTDPLMKPKFADAGPLDKPLFGEDASGSALHNDQFDGQSGKGGTPFRTAGNNDADATSRTRRAKMLKVSKAARAPGAAEKLRKRGAPNPTRGN